MKWTPAQLVPFVQPVAFESLRYLVRSRSRRETRHLVDLGAYQGHGRCMCEYFTTKINPKLRDGAFPTEALECWHIAQARRYLAIEISQTLITRKLKAANDNRKAHKRQPVRYEQEHPEA